MGCFTGFDLGTWFCWWSGLSLSWCLDVCFLCFYCFVYFITLDLLRVVGVDLMAFGGIWLVSWLIFVVWISVVSGCGFSVALGCRFGVLHCFRGGLVEDRG